MQDLGITVPGLLTQLISFSVLAFVLYKLLYGPIVRMLDQRAERIKESLDAAEQARADAASSADRVEEELGRARQEGQQLIAEARDAAGRLREQEEARIRQDIEAMLERARGEIGHERDAAVEEVRQEFASLAIDAAEQVIEQELDSAKHQDLIDRVLKEGLANRQN